MAVSFRELDLLSRQINQAHRAAIDGELAARGLGEVGHPLLMTILERSDSEADCSCGAQSELARMLHISPPAVANSLKSLERGGYIRREPGQDARRNRVILTDKGRQAVQGCRAAFQAVSARMLAGFSQEDLEQYLAFSRRILGNLQSRGREDA